MLELDLKLLQIFEELYRTKSVSHAAENLRLAQPTVSIGLGKLRKQFNDPLFVRTSTGMEPTPRAMELHEPFVESLAMLRDALRHRVVFDPAQSQRCFRVCMTDISQIVLLPRLLNRLKDVAPSIRVDVFPIAADTPKVLEAGDADLAIGFMPQLEAGFYQQKLFEQSFVCMVRNDHPRIGKSLTLKRFVDESHIQITTSGTGHWIIDKVLDEKHIQRKVALRIQNFLGIAQIVESTDLIVTVPQRLAEAQAGRANVKVFKPPLAFSPYLVKQHWHERYHRDPRNKWLREIVAELFLEPEAPKGR